MSQNTKNKENQDSEEQVAVSPAFVGELIAKAVEKSVDDRLSSDISRYPTKDFLAPKKVKVMPVNSKVFINSQVEQLPDGFIMQNAKRSLQLSKEPGTTRFKMIFDDTQKYRTPQFPNEAITELEFFSRVYGADLDPRIPETNNPDTTKVNLWAGRMSSSPEKRIMPIVAVIPDKGKTLDLSNINDHLAYKILKTWGHSRIAQSWEERHFRPSYWFALVDESREQEIKSQGMMDKTSAIVAFDRIKEDRSKLWEVLIVNDPNLTLASTVTKEQLQTTVFQFAENRSTLFLQCINDPNAYEKVLVFKGVRSGHLIRKQENYFTAGNEPLGSLFDVISRLNKGDDESALLKQMLIDRTKSVNL
jgi:hypothetical protein